MWSRPRSKPGTVLTSATKSPTFTATAALGGRGQLFIRSKGIVQSPQVPIDVLSAPRLGLECMDSQDETHCESNPLGPDLRVTEA